MARVVSRGSVDGQVAKVVYYADRKQTAVYWGGEGRPDGPGHNHATIQDSSPDDFYFLRVGGQVVVDHSVGKKKRQQDQRAAAKQASVSTAGLFRESLARALRWWGMGGR